MKKGADAVNSILILTYLMSISCLLHPKSPVDDIFETTVSIHSHDILQVFETEHSVVFFTLSQRTIVQYYDIRIL